ncbi:hypothetical protein NIES2101_17095 [Calothrix sp. HK-06]|nr:hypothetical protein NIES2101_17095 [Calothrix sp. HK-06]
MQYQAIVFVDSTLGESFIDSLKQTAQSNTKVITLDSNVNGIAQITEALTQYSEVESIQIFSHGSGGSLQLGNTKLSSANLNEYSQQLESWGKALTQNGDILLLGCDVAAGDQGKNFAEQLSQLTSADVAASDDLTGNFELNGDWNLEYTTGLIEVPLAFQMEVLKAYTGVLGQIFVTNTNDSGSGSLREAIIDANENSGQDEIIFNTAGTISLSSSLPSITGDLKIDGANKITISGNSQHQILTVLGVPFTVSNLTLKDGLAKGGAGINGGGGGLGAGGALFINIGSSVGVNNVTFTNNSAVGGNSSGTAGAGGADEQSGQSGGAGGGFNINSNFGVSSGGSGGSGGGQQGGGGTGSPGSFGTGGGGGGGGGGGNGNDNGGGGGSGGAGGFGGGGGGGGGGGNDYDSASTDEHGSGGAGGSGGSFAGSGESGQTPRENTPSTSYSGGRGGGGAGLGGAIFVNSGSNLTLIGTSFNNNTARGGTGANNSQGLGSAVFVRDGAVLQTLNVSLNGNDIYGSQTSLPRPTISITPVATIAREQGTVAAQFTVSLDKTLPVDFTINYTLSGSATPGKDYTAPSGSIVIPANTTSTTITIPILEDKFYDPNETITVTLTGGTVYNINPSQSIATQTIVDNEPKILSVTGLETAEGGSEGKFTITLDRAAPTGGLNVRYRIADGSAVFKEDYKLIVADSLTPGREVELVNATGLINIPAGNTTYNIKVVPTNDRILEPTESIIFEVVNNPQNGENLDYGVDINTNKATINLVDNEIEPTISVKSGNQASENNSNHGTFGFAVEFLDKNGNLVDNNDLRIPELYIDKNGNLSKDIAIEYDLNGSAVRGEDYPLVNLEYRIRNDDKNLGDYKPLLQKTLSITPENDFIDEDTESINLNLKQAISSRPYYKLKANDSSATLTVEDNDTAGIVISPVSGNTSEKGDQATFTVRLASQPISPVTINFSTYNAGEGNTTVNSITFDISNWNKLQTVTIQGANDAVQDGNQTYTILTSISTQDPKYNAINPDDITLINFDDDQPNILIRQSGGTKVSEGGATDSYTLVLTQKPTEIVEITVSPETQLDLGSGAGVPILLTFTPDNFNTPQTVSVKANDDNDLEFTHRSVISHTVRSSDSGYQQLPVGNVNVEIEDNEKITVNVKAIGNASEESGIPGIIDFILDKPAPSQGFTINYTITGAHPNNPQAATPGVDFLPLSGSIQVNPGATGASLNITPIFDSESELPAEDVTISIAAGDGYVAGQMNTATTQITDEDVPGLRIIQSGTTTEVFEGGLTDTYQIYLLSQPTADVKVSFLTSGNGQLAQIDPIIFTRENWKKPQTVTVTAIDDGKLETQAENKAIIQHSVSSADPNYNTETQIGGQAIGVVPVKISDPILDEEEVAKTFDESLSFLQDAFSSRLLDISLPIFGSVGNLQNNFIGTFKDSLVNTIKGTSQLTPEKLKNILNRELGSKKFEVKNVNIKSEVEEVNFGFTLTDTYNLLDTPIKADLGFPALGINVDGRFQSALTWRLDVGLGWNKKLGYFIDTENTGIKGNLNLGLSPDFKAQGNLGFLRLDLNNDPLNKTQAKIEFNLGLKDVDNRNNIKFIDIDKDGKFSSIEPFVGIDKDGNYPSLTSDDKNAIYQGIGVKFADLNGNQKFDLSEPYVTSTSFDPKFVVRGLGFESLIKTVPIDNPQKGRYIDLDKDSKYDLGEPYSPDFVGENFAIQESNLKWDTVPEYGTVQFIDLNQNNRFNQDEFFVVTKGEVRFIDINKNGERDTNLSFYEPYSYQKNEYANIPGILPSATNTITYDSDGSRLTFDEIGLALKKGKISDLLNTSVNADVNLGLEAKTSILGKAALPSIQFDLAGELPVFGYQNGVSNRKKGPEISFDNIKLDLGSFASDFARPVVTKINELIKPIRPVIDLLQADTKIFSTLGLGSVFDRNNDSKVSVLEVAEFLKRVESFGKSSGIGTKFFDSIVRIDNLVKSIEEISNQAAGMPILIELGSYKLLDDVDVTNPDDLNKEKKAQVTKKPASTDEQLKTKSNSGAVKVTKGFTGNPDFSIPLLSNPATIVDLLTGKDIPLFTYDLPPLVFDFSVSRDFPVFWPVSGLLGGGFSVAADLAFGYDTYGLRRWSSQKFKPTEAWRVFDGFYVSDRANADGTGDDVNEVTARAYIEAGAGLNFVAISGYVKGGLEGLLGIDLIDGGELSNTSDGRIRPSEITPRLLSPWELFQLSGALNVYVAAEVKSFGAKVWEKRLATFNLAKFSVGPKGNSAGTAFDGDIAAAYVFFDANLNGVLDPIEPYTISNADGTYNLETPLAQFDTNGNGKIDAIEGNIIVVDGIDTSTEITQTTPLITTPEATVASPLTTLATKIAELGLKSAEAKVKQVLGLPALLNLFDYDFQALELPTLSSLGQLQNLVILGTSEIATAIPTDKPGVKAAIANEILEAIAIRIGRSNNPNFSDQITVKTLIQESLSNRNISLETTKVEEIASNIAKKNQEIAAIRDNSQLTVEDKRQQIIAAIVPAELAGGFQNLALKPLSALAALVANTLDITGAQSQIKTALGLPSIDVFNFNPFTEIANGDPSDNGLIIFVKQAEIQNSIVALTQLLSGYLKLDVSEVSYQVIDALIDPITNNRLVNFSNATFLESIIKQVAPDIPSDVVNGAAQIIAEANQQLNTIFNNSSLSLIEKTTRITQVQKVAQGEIAPDLKAVGTSAKTISEVLTENTGNALIEQIQAAVVSNPAFKTDENTLTGITSKETQLTLDVLKNQKDAAFNVTEVFTSKSGTVRINQDKTITYTPNSGFVGEDTFFYVATDGNKRVNGSVTITVYSTSLEQAGNSSIYTGPDIDNITVGDEDNVIKDAGGNNYINAGNGNNVIYSGAGNSEIYAGNGNDFIQVAGGNTVIFAGDGLNNITTGAGDDKINTGNGNDVINAGEGQNTINAGNGNNLITTYGGNDQITTGSGDDWIGAGDGNNTIRAGNGINIIATGTGADNIYTESGSDIINSGVGNDLIWAGAGDDSIDGGDGDDLIYAGDGDDTINPGAGNNRVYTGLGADTIVLEVGKGITEIYRFKDGLDKIQVSEDLQDKLTFTKGTGKNAKNTFVSIAEDIIAIIYASIDTEITVDEKDQQRLGGNPQTPALVIVDGKTQYFEDVVPDPVAVFDTKDLKKSSLKKLTSVLDIANFKVMPNPAQIDESLQQKVKEGIKQNPVKVEIKLPDGSEDITVNTLLKLKADGSLYDFRRQSNPGRGQLDYDILTGAVLQDRNLDGKADWAVVYLQDGQWGDEDGLSNGEIETSLVAANWDFGTSRMEVRSSQDGLNFYGNRSYVQFTLDSFSGTEASEVGMARVRFGSDGQIIEVKGKAVKSLEEAKQSIIERGETLFSSLTKKNPNPDIGTTTRTVAFEEGEQAVFFVIQGTKDELLFNGLNSNSVQFSLSTLNNGAAMMTASNDERGQKAKLSLAGLFDVSAKVLTAEEARPQLGLFAISQTQPQLNTTDELIDLKSSGAFDGKQVKLSLSLQREAVHNNTAYLFRVDDASGAIRDPLTGMLLDPTSGLSAEQKQRYLELATTDRLIQGTELQTPNQQTTEISVNLTGGEYYVPFLVSNGTLSSINKDFNRILTPYLGINSSGVDHVRSLGNNKFGFEDIIGGGDRDYNDMILSIKQVQIIA